VAIVSKLARIPESDRAAGSLIHVEALTVTIWSDYT
jgi:hypothetical protein